MWIDFIFHDLPILILKIIPKIPVKLSNILPNSLSETDTPGRCTDPVLGLLGYTWALTWFKNQTKG